MATKVKIFLSSSAQDELKQLRSDTFDHLTAIGHDPKMYERNFGPWPRHEFIRRCLEVVNQCEMFILLIANAAGSYLPKEDKTVTHLEFREAVKGKKEIIVFVEPVISKFFLDNLNRPLYQMVMENKMENNGREPSVYECIKKVLPTINPELIPDKVDDYTWAFLYDIYCEGIWFEPLFENTKEFLSFLSEYLSDILRRGTQYTPIESALEQDLIDAQEYRSFQMFLLGILKLAQGGTITDWKSLLKILRRYMRGGNIYIGEGDFNQESIGQFNNCEGITVYRKNGVSMERIESDGEARGKEVYYLDQDEGKSYVVDGYLSKAEENLFYREDKNMVYLTSRIGNLIFSFHFALNEGWDKTRVRAYQSELIRAILIEQKANGVFLSYAKKVLGVIKNEA
jgi:hypothetical protein